MQKKLLTSFPRLLLGVSFILVTLVIFNQTTELRNTATTSFFVISLLFAVGTCTITAILYCLGVSTLSNNKQNNFGKTLYIASLSFVLVVLVSISVNQNQALSTSFDTTLSNLNTYQNNAEDYLKHRQSYYDFINQRYQYWQKVYLNLLRSESFSKNTKKALVENTENIYKAFGVIKIRMDQEETKNPFLNVIKLEEQIQRLKHMSATANSYHYITTRANDISYDINELLWDYSLFVGEEFALNYGIVTIHSPISRFKQIKLFKYGEYGDALHQELMQDLKTMTSFLNQAVLFLNKPQPVAETNFVKAIINQTYLSKKTWFMYIITSFLLFMFSAIIKSGGNKLINQAKIQPLEA